MLASVTSKKVGHLASRYLQPSSKTKAKSLQIAKMSSSVAAQGRLRGCVDYMAVSTNSGSFCGCPYNKSPTIWDLG